MAANKNTNDTSRLVSNYSSSGSDSDSEAEPPVQPPRNRFSNIVKQLKALKSTATELLLVEG